MVTENCRLIQKKEPEKRLLLLREAAGAQITQCCHNEVVKANMEADGLLPT